MLLRLRMASVFATVCTFLVVVMEVGVSQAANPTNSSQTTVTDESNLNQSPIEKGMEVLYDMTNSFLDIVQPNHLYDQTWINFTQVLQGKTIASNGWQDYANYGIGYLVCLGVGILFAIFMPIVGFVFCCCRCAGKCGGKKKPNDPKRAKCKKTSYCTVLLILNIFSLAGVVCAFVTNDILHRKLENEDGAGPVGSINSALTNIQSYVNNTADSLQSESLKKYDKAVTSITSSINSTAGNAVEAVLKSINATVYLEHAEVLDGKAQDAIIDLENVNSSLTNLKTNGEILTTNLTELKSDINTTCTTFNINCSSLNVNSYETDADFNQLGDFTTEITKISKSLNISQFVGQAKQKIQEVKENSTKEIQKNIDEAQTTMVNVRKEVADGMAKYTDSILSSTKPLTDIKVEINSKQEDIKTYGNFIWYGGLGISCVFLFIVLFYCFGVLFGLCGDRPGHGAACCNTGAGGNLLMTGVAFSFIFSWILMIVCIVMFVPGGVVYTEFCRYFQTHDPNALKPFDDNLMKGLNLAKTIFNKTDVNVSLVDILNNCKENKAIYSSLYLDNLVDLDKLVDLTGVIDNINKISETTINFNNITILSPSLEKQIKDFGSAGLDKINYTAYEDEIKKNITRVDLADLATLIRGEGSRMANQAATETFEKFAKRLDALNQDVVTPMKNNVTSLDDNLQKLKKHSDVKNETDALISGLKKAEEDFRANGVDLVNEMIKNVSAKVKEIVKSTVGETKTFVREDVGKCRPVFDALYQLTDSACVILLNPLNGFWFSIGWCLFFFIPSIIFAVKLSTLYHREEDYVPKKDLEEPNFAMYAGPSPDRIPLTSMDPPHERGYGAHNTGYRDDGYNGKPQNGYPTHADGPPAYDDRYNRGPPIGHRQGRPRQY